MTADLADTLTEYANAIRALGRQAAENIVEIGRRLSEVKRLVGHGNWLPWLEREFGWTDKTAERFMSVHALAGKFDKLSNLELPISGLYLLAAPSTPETAKTEVIARAEAGETLPVAEVKRVVERHRETKRRPPQKRPAKEKRPSRRRLLLRLRVTTSARASMNSRTRNADSRIKGGNAVKRARISKRPYTYKGKTEDRWLAQWTDLKGARREKWFHNKRHAEEFATRIDRELADNIHVAERGTITFGKLCEAWLRHEEQRADPRNRNASLRKGSLAAKQSVAKNHLLPAFGNMKVDKITWADIKRFIEEQAYRNSHWTARRHKSLINQVLNFAVENDWLTVSPLTNKPIKVPGEEPVRKDVPEVEDVARLLNVLLNQPRPKRFDLNQWSSVRVQIVLGALLGLRPGEIAGLQWENVDLEKWIIRIEHSLSFYDGLKTPKTRSSYRILDLEPVSHRVLTEHAEQTRRGSTRPNSGRALTGYVLTT